MTRLLAYRVASADDPQASVQGTYDGTSLDKDVPEWLLMPLFTFLPDPDFHSFRLVRGPMLVEIEANEQGDQEPTQPGTLCLIGSQPIVEDAPPIPMAAGDVLLKQSEETHAR